jgi:hypothetical protein
LRSQTIVEHHSSIADAVIFRVDTCCVMPVLRAFPCLLGHLAVSLQIGPVVDNAEQPILRVDPGLATQRKSVQAALLDVPKDRLDPTHAVGVDRTAFGTVDFSCRVRQCGLGSLSVTVSSKNATWRTAVTSGVRRHWRRSGLASQVAVVRLNTVALRPGRMTLALLSLGVWLAGHTQVL